MLWNVQRPGRGQRGVAEDFVRLSPDALAHLRIRESAVHRGDPTIWDHANEMRETACPSALNSTVPECLDRA